MAFALRDGDVMVPASKTGLTADLERACHEWSQTLAHFKQSRHILDRERITIGRAIQANGLSPVIQAIVGARYEPSSERFNPADYLSIDRVLGHKNFLRFVGLGAKQEAKERDRKARHTMSVPEPEPETVERADPARVREIMRGAFAKMDPNHRVMCPHDQADEVSRQETELAGKRMLTVHLKCQLCGSKFARNTLLGDK